MRLAKCIGWSWYFAAGFLVDLPADGGAALKSCDRGLNGPKQVFVADFFRHAAEFCSRQGSRSLSCQNHLRQRWQVVHADESRPPAYAAFMGFGVVAKRG